MKNYILSFVVILIAQLAISQTPIEDGKSLVEIRKYNSQYGFRLTTDRYSISVSDSEKKVHIRLKLESQTKKKVLLDPNKFYLLVDQYKIKVRPLDMKFPFGLVSIPFETLYKETDYDSQNNNRKEPLEFSDTFYDYKYEGYKDCELIMNYGTSKKPKLKTLYRKPNKIKNSLLHLVF
nr:hypothetical protein [Bacteroidota bacterium]